MKILYKWYYTPVKLARISPSHTSKCWRNCDIDGHIFHYWWECPSIAIFWMDISTLIQEVTNLSVEVTPQIAPFGLGLSDLPPKFHLIITHILIVARLSIARLWKQPCAQSLSNTIDILNDHLSIEFLFAKAQLTLEKFYHQWQDLYLAERGLY